MKPRPLHFTVSHSCYQNPVLKVTTLCTLFIHLLQSIRFYLLYFNIFVFNSYFLLHFPAAHLWAEWILQRSRPRGLCCETTHFFFCIFYFMCLLTSYWKFSTFPNFLTVNSQSILHKFHKYNYLWRHKH